MGNQGDKDVFEVYNDGVDKILKQFDSCRRLLADLKAQEQETQRLKEQTEKNGQEKLARLDADILEKQEAIRVLDSEHQNFLAAEREKVENRKAELDRKAEEQLDKNDDDIELWEEALEDLEDEIEEASVGLEHPLTPRDVQERTEAFRQNKEIFQSEEQKYVTMNQTQELLIERDKKKRSIEQRQAGQAREAETKAMERFLLERDNRQVDPGISSPGAANQEITRISQNMPALVKAYAENQIQGKRAQGMEKAARAEENQRKNWQQKAAMRITGKWILCFPGFVK